jgi:hypothetical protein
MRWPVATAGIGLVVIATCCTPHVKKNVEPQEIYEDSAADVPRRPRPAEPFPQPALDTDPRALKIRRSELCELTQKGIVKCWINDRNAWEQSLPAPAIAFDTTDGGVGCAVLADHRVVCWGCEWEDLPDSAPESTSSRVITHGKAPHPHKDFLALPLPAATQITLSDKLGCVLGTDSKVYCWARQVPGHKQCFYPGYPTKPPVIEEPTAIDDVAPVQKVVATHDQTCALGANGDVYCWGSPSEHAQVKLGVPVKDIAAGDGHFCAVMAEGKVACWGDNGVAQCAKPFNGCSTIQNRVCYVQQYAPNWVPLPERAVGIAAGLGYSCAVLQGGTVACWGHNPYSLLGFRSNERCEPWTNGNCVVVPKLVRGLTQVERLQLGRDAQTSCAWLVGGEVKCWGEAINARERMPDGSVPECSADEQALSIEELMKLPEAERAIGKYVTVTGRATVGKLYCSGDCSGYAAIDDWGIGSTCWGENRAHIHCDFPLGAQLIATGYVRPSGDPNFVHEPTLVIHTKSRYRLDLARLCIVPGTAPRVPITNPPWDKVQ